MADLVRDLTDDMRYSRRALARADVLTAGGLAFTMPQSPGIARASRARVLDPLGLANTVNAVTGAIPEPVLHAFTSERRVWLGIEPGTRFYEESTFWNPSWTLTRGAVQTSDIRDMAAAMVAVGEGTLLSLESSAAQLDQGLLGFGAVLDGCATCHTLDEPYIYGLGVVFRGPWLVQNPLFSGYSGVSAYLPSHKLAIAVANTYGEGGFDEAGEYAFGNASDIVFNAITASLVPDLATPVAG